MHPAGEGAYRAYGPLRHEKTWVKLMMICVRMPRQRSGIPPPNPSGGMMNKSELIKALAEESSLPLEDASLVVNTFVDAMKDALIEGDRIEIRGFGSFKVKEYDGYAGRNPKTGESVSVIPKRLPFFRAGKELKEFINQ